MSQPRPTNTKPTRVQPNADRYTVLLILSLLAMIIGCVLLYLEISNPGSGAAFRTLVPETISFAGVGSTAGPFVA